MDRPTGRPFATRSEVLACHGMAATSQPLATQIALHVLREGGNAIDAAIAANAVLGLVEPTGCGIGGDLFAIVHDPTHTGGGEPGLIGLNASGRTPRALRREDLLARGLEQVPADGPLSVSVPGCVDGWTQLHARFGSRPLEALLEPAAALAEEGFPLSEVIAWSWERGARRLARQPGFAEVFLPGGRPPRKGERFRNPDLARTLRRIGAEGREGFYHGPVAQAIEQTVREAGGALCADDLARHRSEWVRPLGTSYRDVVVHELPPNTQGFAALEMLNILEGFDLAEAGFGSPDHLMAFVEAKRIAFEDRARWCADPQFHRAPLARLLSKEYAAERRQEIDLLHANPHVQTGGALLEGPADTVYLAVGDGEGRLVSLIQSNFRGFGSGVTPPGQGFCLQSRAELLDLAPGRPNTWEPGKRPFHTIIPAFLSRDGRPWAAFGVMGGATQPQAHAWVVSNLIDFGMNFQEAGDAPRVVHEGSSSPTGKPARGLGRVLVESGFDPGALDELRRRGHRVQRGGDVFGGYQAVAREPLSGVLIGASEARKDGQAAGY